MKKINNKASLLIVLAMFLSTSAYASVVVTLTPRSDRIPSGENFNVLQGEEFSIDVTVAELPPFPTVGVLAFGFNVEDTEDIRFMDADIGAGFNELILDPQPDVAASAFPLPLNGDPLLLATLNFKATTDVELGTHWLGIESDPTVPNNEGLFLFTLGVKDHKEDLTSYVEINVIPEPSTLLMSLLSFAGLGVVAVRMRRE